MQKKRMSLDDIAPELRESIRKIPNIPVANPLVRWLIKNAMKLMPEQQYAGLHIEKHSLRNGVSLRVYIPEKRQSDAALLWIHGGGLVIGSAMQDDKFCAETARELGLIIVSVDYRLAPDFPFPAALDDCYMAWEWLQIAAEKLQINPKHCAIGGESAGGGLAASLVQRIHDAGGIQPVAQWLFCPMLDDRTAAQRELDAIRHFIWDNRQNRFGWSAYLGKETGVPTVPQYAVPARRENLQGLATAWIGTGDIELFFAENRDYAERLKAAGVSCTLDIVTGAAHGFQTVARDTSIARDYLRRSREWLARTTA